MFSQNKLIFDIETIGVDFENLDKISQDYILKYASTEEEEAQAKEKLGFSPLTGEIVAIGVLNPDTNKGAVYLQADDSLPSQLEEGIELVVGSEKDILKKFWEAVSRYNFFISFNGREFDVPFLMIRSAILEIKPTKNLMSNRYLESQKFDALHIDLLDQLTFYGAVRRRFNLHFWSKAFGIESPKEDELTGENIKKFYKEKKYLEIAKYNLKDLKATKALYERWEKYLRI